MIWCNQKNTNISIRKTKDDQFETQRDEDGTPWMVLFENVSVRIYVRIYNLWPEPFIQNSTTKEADMTSHFLSPGTGTCDIIFMAAVADIKRNFNACPYLKTYPYGYNLLPEAFIQNSTTKQAGTTSHFLSPEPGHVTSFLWRP